MEIDQYSFCPCGSGKKFKWCCQNIYREIERVYLQMNEGQQDAALRIMNEIVQAHPKNPEVWGQKAQIHLYLEQVEQAEEALNQAFELNPQYPFGLLMRARLRADEGELTGALILARQAAEAYHPEALDYVAQVYGLIYELEMQRNRPIAGQAALKILIRCAPGEQQLRDAWESTFGASAALPPCARREYSFQHPAGTLGDDRRRAWDEVLTQLESPRLNSLAAAFEKLTTHDAGDVAAWYNLALAQAWLGENRKALDALDRYLTLEADEDKAAQAGALALVLLCGAGLESESDFKQFVVQFQAREMKPYVDLLEGWSAAGRLVVRNTEDERTMLALLLEDVAPAIVTSATAAEPERRVGGYVLAAPPLLRLWSPDEETFHRMLAEVRTKTGGTFAESAIQIAPTSFGDVVSGALVFAGTKHATPEQARQGILDAAYRYFEETWVHRPFKFLAGNTPLDAAGHPVLRKKLLGLIQFMGDCAKKGVLADLDFGRLRHKLGLVGAVPAAAPGPAGVDVARMNTQELAGLAVEGLTGEQLERAFQAARKLDAGEVAEKFGTALVARPADEPGTATDRYPFFTFLLQRSLNADRTDAALDLVNEGQKQDCERNEGRRRNDYELHRAEVHVKRRESALAQEVFQRLIERSPENLKYRGKAAQGMLSLGQAGQALTFAEQALEEARRQNDRDAEGQMLELIEDARRRAK